MERLFHVSSSPHVRSRVSSASIMYDVVIALVPATVFGVYRFGFYAALILLVSIAFALLSEYMFEKLARRPVTISDGSALVTGLLLGLNLPATVPLWLPALGSAFAILFVKMPFGGLGQNFMNPALGARCFLLISFAGLMGNFNVDGISGATPLAIVAGGEKGDLAASFIGLTNGTIGEISAIALLLGGIYLLVKKVISWEIPVLYVLSFVLFEGLFAGKGFDPYFLGMQVCSGGLLLGAIFMATDYVSCPITKGGRYLYALVLGILTGILRTFGTATEGVSYAIILGNLLVPLIERVTMPKAFGYEKNALEGKEKITLSSYKPALALVAITGVAGLLLGLVYQVTKGPIAEAELRAQAEAFAAVVPEAEDFVESEELGEYVDSVSDPEGNDTTGEHGKIVYESCYEGVDSEGKTVGYVVNVTSKDGFGGDITISVGFNTEGETTGVAFLDIAETAGLGMNATNEEYYSQYLGKDVDRFILVKGEASSEEEISALSGASFTSSAVTNAVNAAVAASDSVTEDGGEEAKDE